MSQLKQEQNRLKRMKNEVVHRNPDRLNSCCYQLIPDVTPTKSPEKILKRAPPASTLYYGDLPEIMQPTIEFDKLNPLKNLATPASHVHHVPVILTPTTVTVKPNNSLKSSTTKPPNVLPRVPKTLEVFIPLFKPVWTLHKILEKVKHLNDKYLNVIFCYSVLNRSNGTPCI